jgi:hypothetical protein
MTPLLLMTAGLLAAFSIPADIKSQTMHTIVTKPVERFEIILGRFIGYNLLMTMVLVVMSVLGLVYVARGVNQEAADESLKARVPLYGNLVVTNPRNVGYEWDYRQYITGAVADEYATWTFPRLPMDLADRKDTVRCEFTFDIFRTTKGEENKGVFCTFIFMTWQWEPSRQNEFNQERQQLLSQARVDAAKRIEQNNALAEKYGYFEILSKEVTDFHTLSVDVPAGIFRNLHDWQKLTKREPPLRIIVRCESATQYLGMAKHDLYLLDAERAFAPNFIKGGVLGLWFRLSLIIGLGLTCSTYLSGVISFLTAISFYISGLFLDFIKTVAEGKSIGGGPMENAIRLGSGGPGTAPLEATPALQFAQGADKIFEFGLQHVMNLIPNVDRFDFTAYVAEGFDVSGGHVVLTAIVLCAYLLPWLVLAFYLMRSREIAA